MNKHGGYYGKDGFNMIDFSVNINPLGPSKIIKKSIENKIDDIMKYPEIDGLEYKSKLADSINFNKDNLILGNGGIELIYLYIRTMKPKNSLIVEPTFSEYKRALKQVKSNIDEFILEADSDFNLDIDKLKLEIENNDYDILVLCSPNNPTGKFYDIRELEELFITLKENNTYLLLDESFIDFLSPNLLDYFEDEKFYQKLINEYDNIFIVRSMTKYYSIPGIRLGYAIASTKIINDLYENKEPWSLNIFALTALENILTDRNFIFNTRSWLKKEKNFLEEEFDNILELSYIKSDVNFYLCKLDFIKSKPLLEELIKHNIFIRTCEEFKGLDDSYFRVAVRTREENEKLIDGLKKILEIKTP